MIENQDLEQAFKNYFGNNGKLTPTQVEQMPEKSSRTRMTANGNVSDIDALGEILRKLLNTAWGSTWGIITPETAKGDDPEKIILPQINLAINLREIADGFNPKPQFTDTVNEVVDGKNTGDSFRIYRQTFDCIVEFDFFDSTSKGCRSLMGKFEEILDTYTGFLKEQGVREIFFLKEVPAKYSLNYIEGIPMKCLYYFVRLERIKTVRLSTIKDIEQRLAVIEKRKSTEQNSDDINKKITYQL